MNITKKYWGKYLKTPSGYFKHIQINKKEVKVRQKKAQAAMEFLMTYGWAILAAVIVIAVLASLGVFSPDSSVPNACLLSAPFGCEKNQVGAEGGSVDNLTLVLKNGGGQSYNITAINVTGCTESTVYFEAGNLLTSGGAILDDQEVQTVVLTCGANELVSGDKFSGDVSISYYAVGGTIELRSSGTLTVSVE